MISKHYYLALLAAATLAISACEPDGPAEQAGEAIDDASESMGDAAEDFGDSVGDAAEDACESVEDAANADADC